MRAALSVGEGHNDDIDFARDEENFQNGLKRNIAHLSNLARVNQRELARLQEQVPPIPLQYQIFRNAMSNEDYHQPGRY